LGILGGVQAGLSLGLVGGSSLQLRILGRFHTRLLGGLVGGCLLLEGCLILCGLGTQLGVSPVL
jgi:hypothetical protein